MNTEEIEQVAEILGELVQDKTGTIYIESKVNDREETLHKTESTIADFELNNLIESNTPDFTEETRVIETVTMEEGWQVTRVPVTQLHNLSKKTHLFKAKNDIFFTPNLYHWKQRNGANLWYLTCLFADLDGVSVEEAEERLKQSNLPEPSLKVFSGHGVHFYWKLSQTATKGRWGKTWLKAQDYISTQLNGDRAVNDLARLMRVPLSFNNKENRVKTEILYKDFKNTINLLDFYNQHIKVSKKKATEEVIKSTKEIKKVTKNNQLKKKETTAKTNRINNYNRGIRREILKVIDYRENQDYDWVGTRNSVMVMLKKMKFSEEEMYVLNDSIFHLPQKEVANVINWADDSSFMRRKRIFETLQITADDMVKMDLKYLISEAKAVENKRLKEDLYSKVDILCVEFNGVYKDFKDYLQINYVKKIKSDKKSKKTNKDIANALNISVRGVSNIMKKTAVDKNEMIGKLLDINAKSLDLIEIVNQEKGELNQENIDKLNNLIAKLDRLIDLANNNDEIDAKNRFKIVTLKKKYSDLLELSIVA